MGQTREMNKRNEEEEEVSYISSEGIEPLGRTRLGELDSVNQWMMNE